MPAGTGNRCVMLRAGYIEFLTPVADTPLAAQLRTAIARYVGVHLIAFGTSDPQSDHARLRHGGFSPLEPVALQRQIETPQGTDTARFTVVRVPPGTMAEGRIQFTQYPHNVLVPGVLLALTVLAVNILGDGLRDTLDPKFNKRGG